MGRHTLPILQGHSTPPDKSLTLNGFPVVNKSTLIANYTDIAVPAEQIPWQRGKMHIQSTSGSTGTPLKIPQDTRKRQRRVAELKYFGKKVGFDSHECLIHLRTWNRWQQKTPAQIKSENIYPFDIATLGDSRMRELCELIRDKHALCLRGYASSFDILSSYVARHPQSFPSLRILIAGSEALQDNVRARVKKHLKAEIISQYADEECGILAQEAVPTSESDNVMYLNHTGYFFEVLRMDSDEPAGYGNLGRIVITDLHNYAFPVIRYDTGDVGTLMPPDSRSNGYPVLAKLYGRRLDICFGTDGEPFSPMTIGRVLKHYDKVAQWQFVQKGRTSYTLRIIPAEDGILLETYLADAIGELKDKIGQDANITIERVDDIPVLASGKRKPVVNEYNHL